MVHAFILLGYHYRGTITYIKTSVGIQLSQFARWSLGDCCPIVNCHWSLLVISENNNKPLWIVVCILNILWIFNKHELRKKYPLWILHITAPCVQNGEPISSKGYQLYIRIFLSVRQCANHPCYSSTPWWNYCSSYKRLACNIQYYSIISE